MDLNLNPLITDQIEDQKERVAILEHENEELKNAIREMENER